MRTAVASDEPPEPTEFATGGIIPSGSTYVIGEGGCVFPSLTLPVDSSRIDSAGNVHVTVTIPDGPLAESLRSNALRGLSVKPSNRSEVPMSLLGQTVLYKLAAYDAEQINARRRAARDSLLAQTISGYVVHTGNHVNEGDVFPAVIVADWSTGTPGGAKNLHVLLDGNDTYWATSRIEGDQQCQWTRLPAA